MDTTIFQRRSLTQKDYSSLNTDGEINFKIQEFKFIRQNKGWRHDVIGVVGSSVKLALNYIRLQNDRERGEQIGKPVKGGMFCIAPGCSNEFYKVKDCEEAVLFLI